MALSAIDKLKQDGYREEVDALGAATVHWLRHTGISDDVKPAPVNTYVTMLDMVQAQLPIVILTST